jgi:T-complex protein 1 subunit gamma
LASNCGSDVVRTITELRAKHANKGGLMFGINGEDGKITDMQEREIWDPVAVKL